MTFLVDALKTFELDGWNRLRMLTLMKAAKCYELLGDHDKLVRTAAQIMCAAPNSAVGAFSRPLTSPQERNLYFQMFSNGLEASGE